MIFFIMYFSKSSFQLIKILVLYYCYAYRTVYDITAFIITNGCLLGWIIYGLMLYYSDKNNCDKIPDTRFYISLMFVILFLGYILMFIYLILLCTLPCAYLFLRNDAS
jgi:hypothetical protein